MRNAVPRTAAAASATNESPLPAGRIPWAAAFLAAALLILGGSFQNAGALDSNNNGMSDVWESAFSAAGLSATADTDGDGATNAEEAMAGTNPRSAASVLKTVGITFSGGAANLSWPTVSGKSYQVKTCTSPNGTWINEGSPVAGTGSSAAVSSALAGAGQKFFRVAVSDVDSDGDGVSNWEELQLGLNPYNPQTTPGVPDLVAAQSALSGVCTVTVAATISSVKESGGGNGQFTFSRAGNLAPITISYSVSGPATPGADYLALPGTVSFPAGVTTVAVNVVPIADSLAESAEAITVTLNGGSGYAVGVPSVASLLITDAATSAGGTGLTGYYYAFWTAQVLTYTQVDPTINFDWGYGAPAGFPYRSGIDPREDVWRIHWVGQIQPPADADYTFYARIDDGARLWVNGQLIIDQWADHYISEFASVPIHLLAGVRYDIRMEYYEHTNLAVAQLSWQAPGMAKQIVPQSALYPVGAGGGPASISSATTAVGLVGAFFNYQTTGSGNPTSFTAAGLPPGLGINPGTGYISGTPTVAGTYVVAITATNSIGSGSALLTLTIPKTDGYITREYWLGIGGNSVASIPLATPPSGTSQLTTLEGPTNWSDNYGDRIRGYITPLISGTYRFWIAGDESAELWVSTDGEPINKTRRCFVSAATNPREWTREPSQKSHLIQLTAGQRYYIEVLHKEGAGADHVAVGWLRPDQTGTAPSEVIPGYVLSAYTAPTPAAGSSAIYSAALTPQGVSSTGTGYSTLTLSPDERSATILLNYGNLTSPKIAAHVHDASRGGAIIFDFDTAQPVNGVYQWLLQPTLALSVADIVATIKSGNAYVNVHSAQYPNGEITGTLRLAAGSQVFTPPAAPPALPGGAPTDNEAVRFLMQASFGATDATIAQVKSMGYDAFLENQFNTGASYHLPDVFDDGRPDANAYYAVWWKRAMTAPDQLRQRVAFALSQIFVVSEDGTALENKQRPLGNYYDIVVRNAFGSYRQLLEEVTLSPAMGDYLNMRGNDKPNPITGTNPNENYGREVLQLFSIGLQKMHPDGTLKLNSKGAPIPTYGQETVVGFAYTFTGWNYNQGGTDLWTYISPDLMNPMKLVPAHHATTPKALLDNVVLPANQDANTDLKDALDLIFNHPNVGPFIARRLIQNLVTSNPSPGFIYRVAQKFENNGAGVRGDLRAVVKAILTDYEARSLSVTAYQGFGKQKEPIIRTTAVARACHAYSPDNRYYMYRTEELGQTPMRSPTVFNFFEPDFALSGDIAYAGLVSPEFQITSETTAITSSNFFQEGVFNPWGFGHRQALLLNLATEQSLAGNPTALVEYLNTRLMAGGMSPAMKSTVINHVSGISAGDTLGRARAAVHLISTSPEFVIQK